MTLDLIPLREPYLPWVGVTAIEAMIRNLSLTLESIMEFAAKATAAQQKSLDSLAEVVLDNRIVLDYILAEPGTVCAVANATCYIWITTSAEVETQLT